MRYEKHLLKQRALEMRQKAISITVIEKELGIARSTLSGWFKNIILSEEQIQTIHKGWKIRLRTARAKANEWHNGQKAMRVSLAEAEARELFSGLDLSKKSVLALALAFLYLGEGGKTAATNLGNSDPKILNFYIFALMRLFKMDRSDFRCELHLRADQNPEEIKKYWASALNLSINQFKNVSIDKRTLGRKTYESYKGVCIVRGGPLHIQRCLVSLSKVYTDHVLGSLS